MGKEPIPPRGGPFPPMLRDDSDWGHECKEVYWDGQILELSMASRSLDSGWPTLCDDRGQAATPDQSRGPFLWSRANAPWEAWRHPSLCSLPDSGRPQAARCVVADGGCTRGGSGLDDVEPNEAFTACDYASHASFLAAVVFGHERRPHVLRGSRHR